MYVTVACPKVTNCIGFFLIIRIHFSKRKSLLEFHKYASYKQEEKRYNKKNILFFKMHQNRCRHILKKIKVLKTLMGVERFVNSIRSDTTRSGKFSYDD